MNDPCCGDVCDITQPEAPARVNGWHRIIAAGIAIVGGWLLAAFGQVGASQAAYLVAVTLTIQAPVRRAWQSIRVRALDINVLMVLAVSGAVILGEWLEAATVIWLFAIAQWLEFRSMDRARHAIRALMTLAPATAVVRRGGSELEVPVSEVTIDDRVVVKPGQRIPLDGAIVQGASSVNQAPITGESWPVDKHAGDEVFAGTINGSGALEILVTRMAADTTLAHIVRLVEQAQRQRAPVQTFVERFARVYTPAVVVLAVLLDPSAARRRR